MPRRDRMPRVGDPADRPAVHRHDPVARPETGASGRRALPHRSDHRIAIDRIPRPVADAEDAAGERLSSREPRQHRQQVFEWHREADAGVVEFRAPHHLRGLGRKRGHDADHPAGDVDERPPIVHW